MRTKKDFDRQNEYNKERYDRINIVAQKGAKEEWKAKATGVNLSLNAFVCKAVTEYIERLTPDKTGQVKEVDQLS